MALSGRQDGVRGAKMTPRWRSGGAKMASWWSTRLGSKDKHTRYFHVHEGDPIDEDLVAGWIRQASELPGWIP